MVHAPPIVAQFLVAAFEWPLPMADASPDAVLFHPGNSRIAVFLLFSAVNAERIGSEP